MGATSQGSTDYLRTEVKDYFTRPNEITAGLSSVAPSIFEKHFQILYPAMSGRKVLDVGAGKGRISLRLSEHGSDVTAIDLSPVGLAELERKAAELGLRVRTMQGDAESLRFPDESVDAVFCIETLVHVPDVTRAVKEFARVLKPAGILAVSVTLPLSFRAWMKLSGWEFLVAPLYSSNAYQNHIRKVLGRPPRNSREIRENEITHIIVSHGFKPLYRFVVFSRFLLLIAKKTALAQRGLSGSAQGHAAAECPYLEIYPDSTPKCMAEGCSIELGEAGEHFHLRLSGECVCRAHSR